MLDIGLSKDELLKEIGASKLTPELIVELIDKNNRAILEQLESRGFARLIEGITTEQLMRESR